MAKATIVWAPHRDPCEKAAAHFAVSYMSNAKWFKTFKAITHANLGITRATWKFIESEQTFEFSVPAERDLFEEKLS